MRQQSWKRTFGWVAAGPKIRTYNMLVVFIMNMDGGLRGVASLVVYGGVVEPLLLLLLPLQIYAAKRRRKVV